LGLVLASLAGWYFWFWPVFYLAVLQTLVSCLGRHCVPAVWSHHLSSAFGFFSWLMLLWNWGAVGWWVVSAAAVGKHVVCWVVSSLAVGFFGSPRCMFVQGSLFPLILNWSRESVPLFVQGSLFPLSYVQQACLAYVLVKGLCFLFPCIAGLQRLFDL
jgi:hypothetical protein